MSENNKEKKLFDSLDRIDLNEHGFEIIRSLLAIRADIAAIRHTLVETQARISGQDPARVAEHFDMLRNDPYDEFFENFMKKRK